MVHFESDKLVIEIGNLSNAREVADMWRNLQGSVLFLCANVRPEFSDSSAVSSALAFVEELLPDEETAIKMVNR